MKILIPTAKELNSKATLVKARAQSDKTRQVVDELASKNVEELASIYKIKEEKAQEEYARWQKIADHSAKSYPALELFNGLMYRNIGRNDFDDLDKKYIENHVYITTSLYGVIKAYEPICEHRLDFLQKVKIDGKTLKSFWQKDYDNNVENDDLVISLLSSEFEEVFSKKLREKFVKINFMEDKDGVIKTHSTISKKARGKFLTELVNRKITAKDEIKNIVFDNFKYNEEHSTENVLAFIAKR